VGDAYGAPDRTHVEERYALDVFLCQRCGHAQLLDVVDQAVLYGNFMYETSISIGLVEHFQKYADHVRRRVNPPPGALVVDIGSNDGTLVRFFRVAGLRVLGVDPASAIAEKATASGIETFARPFTAELARQIRQGYGPATIVTANNTFANVDDLEDFTEGLSSLLAPEGVLICETGYLLDLLQNRLVDTIYHEHLGYFSLKPLDLFFRRHGMEIVEAERIPTKGGSLRVMVQRRGGSRKVLPSVKELIELETTLGIDRPEPFRCLAAGLDIVKQRLVSLLQGLKAQGKTIAGYGASVGVTTLLHYFDLGGMLDFLADDNPVKQGLCSPGHHIPVYAPAMLYERKPDYLLILAWRYAGPILQKHQTYLDQGGHVVIPLPEVRVI
jgi:hypothetical protein